MPITPGENIGPYRVMEQLGSGGMATVYKAYHASLDRYVAIKVLHPAFKANPQFFERFQREARIVARLEHAHIIPVYDFNAHQGEPYLVMRFVEGDTLKSQVKGRPLPPAEILRLMRPVCQALTYAHKQGILHRDIKPSNIMVTSDGTVFVTDFGLARMVQAGESTLSQDMMVGTPQYISPEQAQGVKDLDGRTDIYSLGVVLFEMATGRVPFTADTPFATIHDHIYTPLPLPQTINPNIDPAMERLLLKALAKDPADRFQTAEELLQALKNTLDPQLAAKPAVTAIPDQAQKQSSRWWVWAVGAIVVICLLGALLVGMMRWWRLNQVAGPLPDQPPPAQIPADSRREPPPPPEHTPPPAGAAQQQTLALADQATAALQNQQYDRAADLYRQAIETDSHYLPAYFGLSEARKRSGDQAGSIAALEQAVANNPHDPLPLQRLGEAWLVAENPNEALVAFEQAIELDPNNAVFHAERAMALLLLDRDEEAKQAIDTALGLDPLSPETRLANAAYLAKQKEIRPAVLALRELVNEGRAPVFVRERARNLLERLNAQAN